LRAATRRQEWQAEGLRDRISAAAKAYLALMDTDTDGLISPAELRTFVRKVVRFALALADASLLAVKALLLSSLAPTMAMLLDIKAQVVGGSANHLSEADVLCLAGAIVGGPKVLGF
jgi:hypothetical protein